MKTCVSCKERVSEEEGTTNEKGQFVCSGCLDEIEADGARRMECPECGETSEELKDDAVCPHCGYEDEPDASDKAKEEDEDEEEAADKGKKGKANEEDEEEDD